MRGTKNEDWAKKVSGLNAFSLPTAISTLREARPFADTAAVGAVCPRGERLSILLTCVELLEVVLRHFDVAVREDVRSELLPVLCSLFIDCGRMWIQERVRKQPSQT